jgi:hypothetical protein
MDQRGAYLPMICSPYSCRAASRLWALQRIRQFSGTDAPPFPLGRTWSTSSRTVDPQTPPLASGHWHRPSSRRITSRFTFGGTEALRLRCCASSNSSAAVSTS